MITPEKLAEIREKGQKAQEQVIAYCNEEGYADYANKLMENVALSQDGEETQIAVMALYLYVIEGNYMSFFREN